MDTCEQIVMKAALKALEATGAGMEKGPLLDYAERAANIPLTTAERDRVVRHALEAQWIYSYRNSITDRPLYALTAQGRAALEAL